MKLITKQRPYGSPSDAIISYNRSGKFLYIDVYYGKGSLRFLFKGFRLVKTSKLY